MTHMWKSEEVYTFDMPLSRIDDVYGKNARYPLWAYLKYYNPKITDMKFDAKCPGLHVIVSVPKYHGSHPYFTNEDVKKLLDTYMDYANASYKEIEAWYKTKGSNNVKP